MIFNFNKEFKANFQVVEKNFSVSKIGESVFKNSKFEKVEMEGIKFNEEFTIYAENAHDVFYILTRQIMEKLHELNEKIDGELYFGFINNKLYIIKSAKVFFPDENFNDLIFKNNFINGKLSIVLPHPSPLNIKWFGIYGKRIFQIRKIINDVLYNK